MTKKAAALLLAASLAVSVCATPVFADGGAGTTPAEPSTAVNGNDETPKTANTDVNYRVDSKYTWSIPAKIDFGANAGINQTITVNAEKGAKESNVLPDEGNGYTGSAPMVYVTENIIAPEKALKISIDTSSSTFESGDGFYVGVQGKKTIEKLYFKITRPDGSSSSKELTAAENEVLSVASGTKEGKQALVFTLKTTTAKAEKAGTYTGSIAFKSEVSSATT